MNAALALRAWIACWIISAGASNLFGAGGEQDAIKAEVRGLVKMRAKDDYPEKGKYQSEFFATLAKLSDREGLKRDDDLNYRSGRSSSGGGFAILADGHAVACAEKDKSYVAVILGAPLVGIPGISAQQLLLIDDRGWILDKVACGINCRYGDLATETRKPTVKDDTQLIVRFRSRYRDSSWHNWHTLTVRGEAHTLWTQERDPQPTEWTTQGLCRIAIRDGKFAVVWPKLGKSDAEVLKEKAGK